MLSIRHNIQVWLKPEKSAWAYKVVSAAWHRYRRLALSSSRNAWSIRTWELLFKDRNNQHTRHQIFVCSALINIVANSTCDSEKHFAALWGFYIFSLVWFTHRLCSLEKNNLLVHFPKSNGSYASETERIKCPGCGQFQCLPHQWCCQSPCKANAM